jgi:hypothetical protein
MLNNSWKTALIAVASSVVTVAGFKAINDKLTDKDVIINEAANSSGKGLVNFTGLPAGQPGDFTYAAEVSTPTVVHIKAKTTRAVRQGSSIFDQFFGFLKTL